MSSSASYTAPEPDQPYPQTKSFGMPRGAGSRGADEGVSWNVISRSAEIDASIARQSAITVSRSGRPASVLRSAASAASAAASAEPSAAKTAAPSIRQPGSVGSRPAAADAPSAHRAATLGNRSSLFRAYRCAIRSSAPSGASRLAQSKSSAHAPNAPNEKQS